MNVDCSGRLKKSELVFFLKGLKKTRVSLYLYNRAILVTVRVSKKGLDGTYPSNLLTFVLYFLIFL